MAHCVHLHFFFLVVTLQCDCAVVHAFAIASCFTISPHLLSPQTCVIQMIDRARSGDTTAPQSGRSTAEIAAAIAAPVAAVLLLSVAAALLLMRKRQLQQRLGLDGDSKITSKELTGGRSTGNSSKHRSRDNK
jgi:hypothetical protein